MSNAGKLIIVLAVIIIATILITINIGDSSKRNSQKLSEMNKQSLIKADEDFYKASTKSGTGRAFIDFADDSVVLLRQQQFPIIGKSELAKNYLNHESDKTTLRWEPTKAESSPDGKLGYTTGNWTYTGTDKNGKQIKQYGNYVTIWKKQADGKWKYLLDGGNSTPPPDSAK